ncbi:rRNA N(6)-adenosine-methyltransferase ZCCHC4-like isoform X2 [Brevipalpus obovatus]
MHSLSFRKFVNKVTALGVVTDKKEHERPHCKHGPTLLLTKHVGAHERRFLACSADRDNKCPILKGPFDTEKAALQRKKIRKNLIKVIKTRKEDRAFCRSCDELFMHRDLCRHQNHDILDKIPLKYIRRPTMLLKASRSKEREAQYFFSDKTIDFIVETLARLNFTRLISIGCPTIHERIQCQRNKLKIESILLDIDPRYSQFYLRKQFMLYNMFNHFFFEGKESQRKFENFLRQCSPGGTCILIDPPFGGLIQAIARSVDKIHSRWIRMHWPKRNNFFVDRNLNTGGYELGLMIFLPQFCESKAIQYLRGTQMTDYQVEYNHHTTCRDCSCKIKVGSAIRMFTNIRQNLIKMPPEEGYRFCEKCDRFVCGKNRHCPLCDA